MNRSVILINGRSPLIARGPCPSPGLSGRVWNSLGECPGAGSLYNKSSPSFQPLTAFQRCRERKCGSTDQNPTAVNVRLVRNASRLAPSDSQFSLGGLGGRTRTDLNRTQASTDIGFSAMYLIRKSKPKVRHILKNGDSACRMMSTGGLEISKYRIVASSGLRTCRMCKNNEHKPSVLPDFEAKKKLALDKYRRSKRRTA